VARVDGTTASSSFLASGTLIAPDWVLTAAHVVKGATSLTITFADGTERTATGWVANSKFNSGNLVAGNDIGLIHLSSPVTNISPAALYTGSAELGDVGTSVGYGMTGTGATGYVVDWSSIEKRAGQNMMDQFYPVRKGTPNIIMMDFDNPDKSSDSAYGSATPLDLEYLIAPGDSGGGLFADWGAGPQLVGVHSFIASFDGLTNADYGDVSGDTRVSVFNSWIDGAMAGGSGGGGGKGGGKGGPPEKTLWESDYEFACLDGFSSVPEPMTLGLLSLGGLVMMRRRRN
jgi:secreted trypsin-like serine protease